MRRILGSAILAVGLVLAVVACGGGGSTGDDTAEPSRKVDDSAGKGVDDGEDNVSGEGKDWGGWRWKGKRDDCFFVYDNACFNDRDAACKKAGCAKKGKSCKDTGGGPAEVSCD